MECEEFRKKWQWTLPFDCEKITIPNMFWCIAYHFDNSEWDKWKKEICNDFLNVGKTLLNYNMSFSQIHLKCVEIAEKELGI